MGIIETYKEEWENHILSLKHIGLRREVTGDKVTWEETTPNQKISSKMVYQVLIEKIMGREVDCWFKKIWKVQVQAKMIILAWLV